MEIALSLGSNLGDRLQNLQQARDAVAALEGVALVAQSNVYETDPVDVRPEYEDLPYLNAVLVVASDTPPAELQAALHAIEAEFGRVRGDDPNAPRPLDIDMIYAGHTQRCEDGLRLPHPRWSERRFVVQPLADVRPDLTLPGRTRTVARVLADLPEKPGVALFADTW